MGGTEGEEGSGGGRKGPLLSIASFEGSSQQRKWIMSWERVKELRRAANSEAVNAVRRHSQRLSMEALVEPSPQKRLKVDEDHVPSGSSAPACSLSFVTRPAPPLQASEVPSAVDVHGKQIKITRQLSRH